MVFPSFLKPPDFFACVPSKEWDPGKDFERGKNLRKRSKKILSRTILLY